MLRNPSSSTTTINPFPILHLPPPDLAAFLSQFLDKGAPHEVASALCVSIQARSQEVSKGYLSIYQNACQELCEASSSIYLKADDPELILTARSFEANYQNLLFQWKVELMKIVESHFSPALSEVDKEQVEDRTRPSTRGFNHGFVPVLEKFFLEKRQPSHADKIYLSKKSGMKFAQIHTWFQNRRARDKNPEKKKKSSVSVRHAQETSVCRVKNQVKEELRISSCHTGILVASVNTPRSVGKTGSKVPLQTGHGDSFLTETQSHTFPTPYPPPFTEGAEHPFPCKDGRHSFEKPVWARKPATNPTSSNSEPTDLDALSLEFAKMNLDDLDKSPLRHGLAQNNVNPGSRSVDAMAPLTVRPLPGPLPYLERSARASAIPLTEPIPVSSTATGPSSFLRASHRFAKTSMKFISSLNKEKHSKYSRRVKSPFDGYPKQSLLQSSTATNLKRSVPVGAPTNAPGRKPTPLPKRTPKSRSINCEPPSPSISTLHLDHSHCSGDSPEVHRVLVSRSSSVSSVSSLFDLPVTPTLPPLELLPYPSDLKQQILQQDFTDVYLNIPDV